MMKLAAMVINMRLSCLLVSLQMVASSLVILWELKAADAAEFFCPSGNVTCLIAAINEANGMPGEHILNLEPGSYTLQTVDNGPPFGGHGLPVITSSIRINGSADDPRTVIERDPAAPGFGIFHVAASGELTLDGVTVKRGSSGTILNRGLTSLQDSIVTDSGGGDSGPGAIINTGTLRVLRSILSDNGGREGGAIFNGSFADRTLEATVLVENSTIARNGSLIGGGIFNLGSVIVKNSAIIFNRTDCCNAGGGIFNGGGSVEIVNSTIANNRAGIAGAGVSNERFGPVGPARISITNSTIRENIAGFVNTIGGQGGGIANFDGTLQIQNTIIAGNIAIMNGGGPRPSGGPDCFGTITSLGNNLVGDATDCDINLQPSDLTGNPSLDSLVEEELPGRVFYPVLANSPVIGRGNPDACSQTDQLGNPRVDTCDIGAVEFQEKMLVSIDVRPRSDANKINPNSSKNINVVIRSINGFDATTVDTNTVRFGATGTQAAPVHVARRDVDGDGNRDLVVRFQILDTAIKCGDSSATLTGQAFSGASFIGSSPIRTVHCKQNNPKISAKLK